MIKSFLNFVKTVYQNYFEIASCLASISIIFLAILMDSLLGLDACPMCIMSRYAFGGIALISFVGIFTKRFYQMTYPMVLTNDILNNIPNDFGFAKQFAKNKEKQSWNLDRTTNQYLNPVE